MEGYMLKDYNIKHVPYAIGIINTDPAATRQAYVMINEGVPFPASGNVVMKVLDAVDNVTTLNVAEIDKKNREYNVFDTITIQARKLKKGDPLEVYAWYKEPRMVTIKVCSGRSGRTLGTFDVKINRPPYKEPAAPVRATSVSSAPAPEPVKPMTVEEANRAKLDKVIERTNALINGKPIDRPVVVRNTPKNPVHNTNKSETSKKSYEEIKEETAKTDARIDAELKKVRQKERQQAAFNSLDSMVGLKSVKESLRTLVNRLEYEAMRNEALGKSAEPLDCPRFVFNGNPGTGKTTVARLIGDICYGCGLLEKGELIEVSRSDLIGEFVGQTGKKTKEICDKAHGNVLFIDEAYALVQKNDNDYGKEAIAVLIKEMEDHRKDMVVILAGYTDEMTELLETNSGIQSRITDTVTFEDYTAEELFEIARGMAGQQSYEITPDGRKAFEYLMNEKKVDKKFGNAREVRTSLDKAISRKAMLYSQGIKESLTELTAADFGVDIDRDVEVTSKDILLSLERLIGLGSVKKDVRQIINKAKYMLREINEGNMTADQLSLNMNLCFTGNPGTGKTTVARIYAALLHSIGLAKTDKVFELSRSDLVAPYMGQTALKTKEACERAYGGVMFIDEAYSLVQSENDSFGREALDTLIKEMEDNRDKLTVIFAGYTKEMGEFMERNSGLKSRVSRFIEFEDYNVDELLSIFDLCVKEKKCIIDADARLNVKAIIRDMVENKDRTFGNAREIRKLTEDIFINMITRVEDNELEGAERRHIINDDVVLLDL